jgi:hypothetical protein
MSLAGRHGGRLSTPYFHQFTSRHLKSLNTTQKRLNILFNELGFFTRPGQQERVPYPNNKPILYQLSPKGEEYLRDVEGLDFTNAPAIKRKHQDFEHEVMSSAISASCELNTLNSKYNFTPQHELGVSINMAIEGDTLKPDGAFRLSNLRNQVLVFREEDRGTEPLFSKAKRKSIEANLQLWKKAIGGGIYKDHFNVKHGALLLFSTVRQSRMERILDMIDSMFPNGCPYILLQNRPEFGWNFASPQVLNVLGTKCFRSYKKSPHFRFL